MIDRVIDAVDEWFHRRGFGWVRANGSKPTVTPWWGHLVLPLCNLRERRLWGKDEWRRMKDGGWHGTWNPGTTTSGNTYSNPVGTVTIWTRYRPMAPGEPQEGER